MQATSLSFIASCSSSSSVARAMLGLSRRDIRTLSGASDASASLGLGNLGSKLRSEGGVFVSEGVEFVCEVIEVKVSKDFGYDSFVVFVPNGALANKAASLTLGKELGIESRSKFLVDTSARSEELTKEVVMNCGRQGVIALRPERSAFGIGSRKDVAESEWRRRRRRFVRR